MTALGDVAGEFERLTAGWTAERKAAAWTEVLRGLVHSSVGRLAAAIDPTTVQTPALSVIDSALADVDAGMCDRLIISMPPQEGKSTRVSRHGVLWALRRNPDRRVAIASYGLELAAGHGRWIRDQIDAWGTWAPHHGGRDVLQLAVARGSRSASRWDLHGHRGGVYAVGVGGGLTGRPVDLMVIDDPIKDRRDADSITVRGRVWDWWQNVVLTRLAPGAPVVIIMTRWHEDDLAGRLLAEDAALPEVERQWRVINIAAECEDPDTDPLGRQLGEFMDSARRRTPEQWAEKKRAVGARTWAALYQGHPAPAEGGIFKWEWIRPYRVGAQDVPQLQRVVVAVDTTGGGHDSAGIVAAGRGVDRRTYMLADRSGPFSAGGQWRKAWMAVLDLDADVLVYERNLVDPVMRKAIPAAWRRMRDQAAALDDAGVLVIDLGDVDAAVLAARVRKAALQLVRSGDDDVMAADDPLTALTGQLHEVLPYARRVLDAPELGPARVHGVLATRGKATRAEPVSQAYETGQVSHVGVFPALEGEMVTWQDGQDSPNRLDAMVWAWTSLNANLPGRVGTASGRVPTGTAAAVPQVRRGVPGRP